MYTTPNIKIMKSPAYLSLVFLLVSTHLALAQMKADMVIKDFANYRQKAMADASKEQNITFKNESQENAFWRKQELYEQQLQERSRMAYETYLNAKREAYAAHIEFCSYKCNHGPAYYVHAHGYYTSPVHEFLPRRSRPGSMHPTRLK
ncbi:MAG: hypothetical protein CL868_19075 [Cytophagaceae bacterium]|nr:hypothetical protein [Cytophagaceae bacterium]|tara:strand:+ start:3048 stop:3491 length:444 start_codon:yes stop_codon:yes gene_type:complete